MNIFEREARDIVNFFERHGYEARVGTDHVIVDDPVLFMSGSDRKTMYKEVMIRGWEAAIRFVEERE